MSDHLRAADPQVGTGESDLAFNLPADFTPPAGIKLGEFDASTPLAKAAREFAHREGLSQQQFSRMLQVYAQNAVREIENYKRSIEQETARLGPRAAERGQAVRTWLVDRLGSELAGELTSQFTSARHIEAFEQLRRGDKSGASILDRWYPTR